MASTNSVLIIGGTPQGLQAALTLAACNRSVTLVEKNREIGRADGKWPDQARRWTQYLRTQAAYHPLVDILTETEVTHIEDSPEGAARVEWIQRPQWISPELCVDCQKCLFSCPVELSDGSKPIFELCAPHTMAIDKREKAPCRLACPLDMNPQGYVAWIGQGKFDEAYQLILEKNPLPGVCGRVCHHPCETECRRKEIDEPIGIRALKRFAADVARKRSREAGNGPMRFPKGPRIAIIGSGPSGLTAAHEFARAGFSPTLIEADGKPGGLLHQGIAPYRLPREIIEQEIDDIMSLGVELRLNSSVKAWEDLERLKSEGFRAILLATGASKDLRMGIRGEDSKGIYGCVSFLRELWKGKKFEPLGRLVVIGGGNAAVEAARAGIRAGAGSVTLIYRRTRKEMPADPHEVEQALEEGVKLKPLTVPVEFESENGRLCRLRCVKMKLEGRDDSGRRRPVPIEGSNFLMDSDTAIVSIGQGAVGPLGIGGDIKKTPLDGLVISETGETNIAGIYASGDTVTGPSTVVEAMASGRRAAQTIIGALDTAIGRIREKNREIRREPYNPIPKDIPRQVRSDGPHRKISERIRDYGEVIACLSAEDAAREAGRCLQCGICCECLQCEASCELGAIGHGKLPIRRFSHFDQIIMSDNRQAPSKSDLSHVISIGRPRDTNSWARAMVAGRSAAMEVLSKTSPAQMPPMAGKCLRNGDSKIGIFICSCNGSLNPNNQLAGMIEPLKQIPDVAHVEVLVSACHPEMGRRIEEVISAQGLNGALIASCVCCNLGFACESCTEQRIRLKQRLFKEVGYAPKDIALVNIKETCLLPYRTDGSVGIDRANRVIRSGLSQLREHKAWALKSEKIHPQALVLGATEAGIAAAKGLKTQFHSVVLAEDGEIHQDVEADLRKSEIDLLRPVKPVRLEGQRGNFTLIFERLGRSGASISSIRSDPAQTQKKRPPEPSSEALDENPPYQQIHGGVVILGRKKFKNLRYQRDAFSKPIHAVSSKAFGTLETGVPGVYMASWSQAIKIPDKTLGASVAGKALEDVLDNTGLEDSLAAQVDPEFCRGCGRCADICPEGAAHLEEISRGVASSWIDPRLCTGCGNCISECPTGAVHMAASEQQYYEEVMNAILG